jgi:hypothetical protein
MPTVTKSPRDPWPGAARDLEIVLLPGVHQAAKISGKPDMILRGGEGVIIEGSIVPSGGEPPCTLRVMDGAHRLQIIGPIEVRYSEGRGIRITEADDIVLSDIYTHHHGIEGIITGNCQRGTYDRIRCEDSRSTPDGYAADKRHGLYISGNAGGSVVQGLDVSRVTGSGLQVNGASLGYVITMLEAREMTFTRCGGGGTPPISLMGVCQALFERFCVYDVPDSRRWCTMFADGQGSQYACRENTFQTYTIPPAAICAEEEGSGNNSFSAAPGWSPGPAPEPPEPVPPEPVPPAPNEALAQALADADEALASIGAQTLFANAAIATATAALAVIEAQTAIATEAIQRAAAAGGGAS